MSADAPEWAELHGIVIAGYGIASGMATDSPYPKGSIELQLPFFRRLGVDLSQFYLGTLNVSIAPRSVYLHKPSYTFRSVCWSPDHEPEDFSFSPCQVAHRGRWHAGFIYYPHEETKPRHHHAPSTIEIITDHLSGIEYGTAIDVLVRRDEVTIRTDHSTIADGE